MIEHNKYKSLGWAALSGLLLFLTFPNASLYYLAWIALIPLLIAIENTDFWPSFAIGFITGFIANIGTLYWIYTMIRFNTDSWQQAAICLIFLSGYMALYVGVWAALLSVMMRPFDASIKEDDTANASRNGASGNSISRFGALLNVVWYHAYKRMAGFSLLRASLFAASLWVSLEYIRTYFLTGFPWLITGMSQWKFTTLIQICEFTGVYGISFLIIFVNVSLAKFIRTKKLTSFVIAIAGVACVTAVSYVIMLRNNVSSPPYMSVAVLQGNIDQYKKWDDAFQNYIMSTYSEIAEKAASYNPDLIVWPETAVPGYLPTNMFLYDWVRSVSKNTRTYNLIGSPYNNGGRDYFNSVLLFGPEGEILGVHKKTHLVPFGEFVPFRKLLEPYFGVLNSLGDFSKGSDYNVFPVKSIMCASTICSENFFGKTIRRFVLNGAEVLINQTNDAWFFRTAAARQHFIMNIFRAVENRRPVIVAGNTGISGIVNSVGAVTYQTGIFEKTFFFARVSPRRYITFYTKYGDIFAQACLVWTALMLLLVLKKKRHDRPFQASGNNKL